MSDLPDYWPSTISGVKTNSSRPPRNLGLVIDSPSNPQTGNFVLDPDVQALVVVLPFPLNQYVHLKIAWHPVGAAPVYVPLELFSFQQSVYVIPLPPTTYDGNSNPVNSIDVTLQGTSLGNQAVQLIELFEPNPLWLEFYAPPFAEPNQIPLFKSSGALANAASDWLITPVANVQISLFEVIEAWIAVAAATPLSWFIGHGTTKPTVAPPDSAVLCSDGSNTQFRQQPATFEFHGAPLPRGDGIWIWNNSLNNIQYGFTLNYSLS